jgi:1-deoxyxylulose-5-phosphate synthase
LMQLHSPQAEEIRRGELADALQELQKAGRIRFLGVTTYGEEASLAAIEDGRYDCIQIAYSALDREPEARVLPLAQAKDIGVVARSVLLKGTLTHRYRYLPSELEELRSAAGKVSALAEAGSIGLPEFAYRFVFAHPAVSSALVGTASIDELKAALGYCARGALPPDSLARVRQITINDRRQLNPATWPIQ